MSTPWLVVCTSAALFVLVACDGDMGASDASLARDAAVSDGGGLLDAGFLVQDASPPPSDAGGSVDAGVPLCAAGGCDPRDTTACTGQVCLLSGAAPACESVMQGMLRAGMPCEASAECAPGLACFLDEGEGVCGRVCCPTDGSACAVGSRCGGAGVLVDGTETSWGRCLAQRSCDVLRPSDTCEAREGCYLLESTGMTECRIAGTAGPGEACEFQEDCAAGFWCGGVAAARRCVRLCSVREDACPTEEGRCVAQTHTPDEVGLCTMDMTTFEMNRR